MHAAPSVNTRNHLKDVSALHGIIPLSKLHIFVISAHWRRFGHATVEGCRALRAMIPKAAKLSFPNTVTFQAIRVGRLLGLTTACTIAMAASWSPAFSQAQPIASAITGTVQGPPTAPVVQLFAPPRLPPGREASSLVIGAIAANFWLDGDTALSAEIADYFASKTDPLRASSEDAFLALIDQMRDRPISVPLFSKLVREQDARPRLGFAWEDENVSPPPALTFRTAMDRHCFTLNMPLQWARLIDAPLELPAEVPAHDRNEVRLEIIAQPADAYGVPVAGDARQVFGISCRSHTVITAEPMTGILLTVDGAFLTTIDPARL